MILLNFLSVGSTQSRTSTANYTVLGLIHCDMRTAYVHVRRPNHTSTVAVELTCLSSGFMNYSTSTPNLHVSRHITDQHEYISFVGQLQCSARTAHLPIWMTNTVQEQLACLTVCLTHCSTAVLMSGCLTQYTTRTTQFPNYKPNIVLYECSSLAPLQA